MTVSTAGHRIAAGWYRADAQLTLTLYRGRGLDKVPVWSRIVPKGRFRVRPVDSYGPRDAWHEVSSPRGEARYVREHDRR